MKSYLVGGAIRDNLLGLKPKERDWVVVGSSPDEMKATKTPVGGTGTGGRHGHGQHLEAQSVHTRPAAHRVLRDAAEA